MRRRRDEGRDRHDAARADARRDGAPRARARSARSRGVPGSSSCGVASGGAGRLATIRRDALWYPLRLGRVSARSRPAALHDVPRAASSPRAPLVVTVHDLGAAPSSRGVPRAGTGAPGALALRSGVRAADAVVAVSAFTRDELVDLLRVPVERIRVVPNGVDAVFSPDGPAAEGDYVLAVGTLEPRKNLAAAVEAARLAGVELRVAGAAGWGDVAAPGWVGEPSDEELAAPLCAERAASSTRRSTRASACRCSRRWPAATPS